MEPNEWKSRYMKFAQIVLEDLDGLIQRVGLVVTDKAQARRLVDGIEELHSDYAEIIRDLVMGSEKEGPRGNL